MHAPIPPSPPRVFRPGRAARTPAIGGLRPLVVATLLACSAVQANAQALPNVATVINGTAGINTFSNGLQVVNSPGAIIHWDSFSIGNGRTVRFDQLTPQSAVLNRVTGNAHSEILGTLQSNGRVFLLNPNGILFGAGARVDVAGLLASTLDISNADFLAGNYRFSCFNATVCEAGVDVLNPFNNRIVLKDGSQITTRAAGEGGQVWLIARDQITSEKGSRIEAPTGQVMAAAAREVTITSPALGNMTFTLGGTVGSRINLEGDIDVPRGAAGFFADTIRLAGSVRARSDAGAAGQIVASAAGSMAVEGDARLDVSGTAGADAGAIRLGATQRIVVAASVDLSADGGAPANSVSGGAGGLIELAAAEVLLPGKLSYDGPFQLHARGSGVDGLETARDGRINVLESGTFAYDVLEGPSWVGGGQSIYASSSAGGNGQLNAAGSIVRTELRSMAPSGDGRLLVITRRSDLASSTNTTNTNSGLNTTHATSQTLTWTYEMHVLNADGSVAASRVLSSESATRTDGNSVSLQERFGGVVGLSKGGWVIPDGDRLLIIQADSLATTTVQLAGGASVTPLLSGGVLAAVSVGDGVVRQVYDAQGRAVPDTGAALANEPLLTTYAYRPPSEVNFEERRKLRIGDTNVLERFDVTTGAVERSFGTHPAGTRLLASLNDTALLERYPGIGTAVDIGAADGDTFTPLLQSFSDRSFSGGMVQGVGGTTGESSSSTGYGGWQAVSSALLATVKGEQSYDLTHIISADHVQNRFSETISSTTGDTMSMRLVSRTLASTPVATAGTTGRVAASLLLASLPGSGNGSLGGDGGVVLPPVNPGTPGTPVTPPAVSPLDLPPPADLPGIRPAPRLEGEAVAPPGIAASITNRAAGDAVDEAALLQAARDVVLDALGPRGLVRFDAADGPRERAAVLQEAAYSQAIGPDLYAATEFMGAPMRQTLFTTMADLQKLGVLQDEGLFDGLERALTVKRQSTNADGSTGPSRTPLEVPLMMLEVELAQATTVAERKAIQARAMREMIIAAREEAGETVDDTADVTIVDTGGATVRITEDGKVIRD